MALTTLQTVGLGALAIGTGAIVYTGAKRAIQQAREQKALPDKCPEGLSPRMVDGEWQCLPVTPFEECLGGVFSNERVALPESIYALLNVNAKKTVDQFYGFHLSPEAIEAAWVAFGAALQQGQEEEAFYLVLADLMPCGWPLWFPGEEPGAGFAVSPEAQLAGWPMDFNYYLDPPTGVTDRMEKAARSLLDLFILAVAQQVDQYLPVDVDPLALTSDPERDLCASGDVLSPRAPSVPTSETVILGAIAAAGYDPQAQNVDEIMAMLETERPLLIQYLESEWRVPAQMQDRMWDVMLDVANFPRPVTNTVYNVQSQACPWDEKGQYTLSMATMWYAAKRIAAIAELAGMAVPVVLKEG